MGNPKISEHLAEREERMIHLVAEIDAAILDSENLREYNTLAMALLIRALDLFHASYNEAEVLEILNFMFTDRKNKRRVSTSQEYVDAIKRTEKWLPPRP